MSHMSLSGFYSGGRLKWINPNNDSILHSMTLCKLNRVLFPAWFITVPVIALAIFILWPIGAGYAIVIGVFGIEPPTLLASSLIYAFTVSLFSDRGYSYG